MIRRLLVLAPTLLVASAVSTGAWTPSVVADTSCTITQVTDTPDTGNFSNTGPVISSDGTRIAFESNQNHTGFNADGNQEIVLYDIAEDDFRRVSATTGGTFSNRSPAINADGSRVAWSTDRSIIGNNIDLNREIVRWTQIGAFAATVFVTNTAAPVVNGSVTMDDAGDDLVVRSQNAEGTLLLHHRTTGSITTELTPRITGEISQPRLNAAGTHVVYTSNGELGGSNSNGGHEVFLQAVQAGTPTALTDQVADFQSVAPVMSDNTRRVAFVSKGNFAGLNEQNVQQAFLLQRSAPVISRLTSGDDGTFVIGAIGMNARGTRMVFDSDGDHAGMNGDGSFEIFVHDFGPTGERITQITDDAAGSGEVDIDASGRNIVFSSRGDHVGSNADGGREIFLATCEPPPSPSQCNGLLVTVELGRGEEPTQTADVIRGTPGADTVSAGPGDDVFCGLGGADVFEGGLGKDWADGGAGPDRLDGGRGADRLKGAKGADRLNGGRADDVCLGGPGDDRATRCETVTGVP
jgi:Tol biopolymer transport system component